MIPQHYPIEAGKLYGGEYPGDRDPHVAMIRLRHLVTLGIRTFVDLTAPADRMTPYEGLLAELEEEAGAPLRRISLPIADMGIPEAGGTMQTILRKHPRIKQPGSGGVCPLLGRDRPHGHGRRLLAPGMWA